MIQRIQTIYLFLAAVCGGLLLYLPIFKGQTIDLAVSYVYVRDQFFLEVVDVVIILFCLVTIFFYKNRVQQMKNCFIIIAINILFLVLIGVTVYLNKKAMPDGGLQFSCFLPVLSALCAYLAFRNIRKDENLVKSMDRMR
jgi:hypothetical protein